MHVLENKQVRRSNRLENQGRVNYSDEDKTTAGAAAARKHEREKAAAQEKPKQVRRSARVEDKAKAQVKAQAKVETARLESLDLSSIETKYGPNTDIGRRMRAAHNHLKAEKKAGRKVILSAYCRDNGFTDNQYFTLSQWLRRGLPQQVTHKQTKDARKARNYRKRKKDAKPVVSKKMDREVSW